jgi:hypothetical protein
LILSFNAAVTAIGSDKIKKRVSIPTQPHKRFKQQSNNTPSFHGSFSRLTCNTVDKRSDASVFEAATFQTQTHFRAATKIDFINSATHAIRVFVAAFSTATLSLWNILIMTTGILPKGKVVKIHRVDMVNVPRCGAHFHATGIKN